eukprot:IDg1295t1
MERSNGRRGLISPAIRAGYHLSTCLPLINLDSSRTFNLALCLIAPLNQSEPSYETCSSIVLLRKRSYVSFNICQPRFSRGAAVCVPGVDTPSRLVDRSDVSPPFRKFSRYVIFGCRSARLPL